MENKYYTPKIEEFHVGFEFETKEYLEDSDEWSERFIKKIMNDLSWFHDDYCALKENAIRVKYLDREDIESLGWIHEEDNLFSFKSGEVTYYLILYPKFDNKIEIRCTHPSVSYGNFLGNCKNKSELKRVMEQLTINKL